MDTGEILFILNLKPAGSRKTIRKIVLVFMYNFTFSKRFIYITALIIFKFNMCG